jgi:hypothetical protein
MPAGPSLHDTKMVFCAILLRHTMPRFAKLGFRLALLAGLTALLVWLALARDIAKQRFATLAKLYQSQQLAHFEESELVAFKMSALSTLSAADNAVAIKPAHIELFKNLGKRERCVSDRNFGACMTLPRRLRAGSGIQAGGCHATKHSERTAEIARSVPVGKSHRQETRADLPAAEPAAKSESARAPRDQRGHNNNKRSPVTSQMARHG